MSVPAAESSRGLPKSARLRRRRDFQWVFSNAVRSADRYFTALARRRDGGEGRLGLAISVRRAGRHVTRNRIKRLVRESFRHRRDRLNGLDIVVMARRGARDATNAELYQSLARHWDRLAKQCRRS